MRPTLLEVEHVFFVSSRRTLPNCCESASHASNHACVMILCVSVCVGLHKDLTLLPSCTCVSLVTELWCALDHSSKAFALAQGCHNTELHLSWLRSAVQRHRKRSHWEALEIRGRSSSSRTAANRYGQHSRLDDVTAADQTGDGRLFAATP